MQSHNLHLKLFWSGGFRENIIFGTFQRKDVVKPYPLGDHDLNTFESTLPEVASKKFTVF